MSVITMGYARRSALSWRGMRSGVGVIMVGPVVYFTPVMLEQTSRSTDAQGRKQQNNYFEEKRASAENVQNDHIEEKFPSAENI